MEWEEEEGGKEEEKEAMMGGNWWDLQKEKGGNFKEQAKYETIYG